MPPRLALTIVLTAIGVMLFVDRRRGPKPSFALWLPTLWMLLAGSRPVSRWLSNGGGAAAEGNSYDRVVLAIMILLGALVLSRREIHWRKFFRDNVWLILFFLYIGVSALWTDFPFVAFKRWIRTSGVIVMAMIVMSEAAPLAAFERILRRCAYILVPLSIVFIKYFPAIGRSYARWDGVVMWTGATTHKNSLGALCAVSVVVLVLGFLRSRESGGERTSWLQTFADIGTIGGALLLMRGAEQGTYSATAIAIALLGCGICVGVLWRRRGGTFMAAHLRAFAVAAVAAYLAFWDVITKTGATLLGRRTDLTGRATEIWPLVLQEANRHPLLGSGYGGVWGLNGKLSILLGLEQAHNGYLDVYLQLGIVGCVLLALFLLEVCARVGRQFTYDRRWGAFGIAFVFMNLIYNLSETAFFDVYLGAALVFTTVIFGVSDLSAARARDVVEQAPVFTRPPKWSPPVPTAVARPAVAWPPSRPVRSPARS